MLPARSFACASVLLLTLYSTQTGVAQDAVARTALRVRARPDSTSRRRSGIVRGASLTLLRPDTVGGYLYVLGPHEVHGWVIASGVRVRSGAAVEPHLLGTLVAPLAAGPLGATDVGGEPGTFHHCPVSGDAKLQSVKALNRLKNRASVPTASDIDPAVSLAAVLKPGSDISRWNAHRAAVITGFVVTAHKGGNETGNCHATNQQFMDTHINVALIPADSVDETRQMVVEVAPRWRPNHPQWTTPQLAHTIQGHWVRFTGWLMFDAEHSDESENTAPGKPGNWRATAWELHPVTAIEVLPGPPPHP